MTHGILMLCLLRSSPFLFHDRNTICHIKFVVTETKAARSHHDKKHPSQPWFVNRSLEHLENYQACLWVVSPPNIPKDDDSYHIHVWFAAAYDHYPYLQQLLGKAVVDMSFKFPSPQLYVATVKAESFTLFNTCLGGYTLHSVPFSNITNYYNHALPSTSTTYLQGSDALPPHTSFWMQILTVKHFGGQRLTVSLLPLTVFTNKYNNHALFPQHIKFLPAPHTISNDASIVRRKTY